MRKGEVTNVVNAAGVSPSQAPVAEILRVDLYGTSVLLEEFGKVIAEGGSGVIISSQSGHRLSALPQEQNEALATTPVDELLELPFLKEINDTLKAYQYSKRCNVNAAMCFVSCTRQPVGAVAVLPLTLFPQVSSLHHWPTMNCMARARTAI